MGSSFLTTIKVALSLYSIILFIKTVMQFGLPNHPARFLMYLVTLCTTAYFTMVTLVHFQVIAPWDFVKLQALPMVAGSLALLFQIISSVGNFSLIQQKVISRIPLMAALLFFAFFPHHANIFLVVCILVGVLMFTISVGKVRYQKRIYFKMAFFLMLSFTLSEWGNFWVYTFAKLFLFFALFYFYIFQQTFGISAMVEKFQAENAGVPS